MGCKLHGTSFHRRQHHTEHGWSVNNYHSWRYLHQSPYPALWWCMTLNIGMANWMYSSPHHNPFRPNPPRHWWQLPVSIVVLMCNSTCQEGVAVRRWRIKAAAYLSILYHKICAVLDLSRLPMPLTIDVYIHHHLLFQLSACQGGAVCKSFSWSDLLIGYSIAIFQHEHTSRINFWKCCLMVAELAVGCTSRISYNDFVDDMTIGPQDFVSAVSHKKRAQYH